MATVRKYKTGGAVPDEGAAEAAPKEDAVDVLRQALDASRAAEAAHREAAKSETPAPDPRAALEQQIEQLPVDGRIKTFLKRHPHVLDPRNKDAVEWHRALALRDGLDDASDAMHQRILDGIAQEQEFIRQRRAEMAERATPTATAPQVTRSGDVDELAERLDREASAIGMSMNAAASTPEGVAEDLPEPEPKPEPKRKGIPMVAPVARNVPSYSGRPDTSRSVTLSPEEREVARTSMNWLPPAQAERQYEQNKRKMLAAKERGEIQ